MKISIKYTFCLLFFRKINDVMRRMISDWSCSDTLEEWKIIAHYSYVVCNAIIYTYFCGVFSYFPEVFMSYFSQPIEKRAFVFQAIYPFEYMSSPNYEIVTIVQIIQGCAIGASDSVTLTVLVVFVRIYFHYPKHFLPEKKVA